MSIDQLPGTMRAAYLMAPRTIEVRDTAVPTPGPGEVVVRVSVALTCGTELKAYRQGHRLFKPPMALGHEYVGTVASVGLGVDPAWIGKRVTTANSAPCETCDACRRGRTNLCANLQQFLLFGAFAEYVRVSAPIVKQNLLPIADGVPDEVAAFVEPFACVVQGNEGAAVQAGETVAVFGGSGPIGLMFLQLLARTGASAIAAVGRKPHRLALARQLGATHAIDAAAGGIGEQLLAAIGAPDVIIEITGIPELIELAVRTVRPGGRVILFGGSTPGATAALDLSRIHYEEVTVKGVFHHTPRTIRESLRLLSDGTLNTRPLLSATMPLEEAAEAMRRFDTGDTMKIAIVP